MQTGHLWLPQVTESFTVPKAGTFLVRSVSREHKHTSAHTGLMMWDASPVLAAYLASSPHLLNGANLHATHLPCA